MKRILSTASGLIAFLIAQQSIAQTNLQNATTSINDVINGSLNSFISQMVANMETGASTIVDPDTGLEYQLTQDQIDTFNAAYEQALQESTQEYLTNLVIQENILEQQVVFAGAKDDAIEAAESIATVTAIAAEIESASESQKIQLESYATANDLREIDQADVQKFNASIQDMVDASRTKNMLEVYGKEIVESTTFMTQATGTVQAFYDGADFIASSFDNSMTVQWGAEAVVIDELFFGNEIEFDETIQLQ